MMIWMIRGQMGTRMTAVVSSDDMDQSPASRPAAWKRSLRTLAAIALLLGGALAGGCIHQPQMLPIARQKLIDRALVEYPSGFELRVLVDELNTPTAMATDDDGNLLVAESGGPEPHIFGYRRDGSYFNIYPYKRNISFYPTGFVIYGPIGGMICHNGKIYITHRDRVGKGMVTALGYDGSHATIVGNLPAQGDYGVTDLVYRPTDGRLYFGVGTATNSAVVGVDNWDAGWLKRYPEVHDIPFVPGANPYLYLLGRRFDTPNPRAGLFGGANIAVTGPFQPFGVSNQTRIRGSDRPNGAIYSIPIDGGDLRVEAYGIHNPRGLAINKYDRLYMTNDGMQLRGTRPIKDDPDSLVLASRGNWYGWPDYTTDLNPVSAEKYQPLIDLVIRSGYPDVSFLIDHATSSLRTPTPNEAVFGAFTPMSGAARLTFLPDDGPFKEYAGSAIVALMAIDPHSPPAGKKTFWGRLVSK